MEDKFAGVLVEVRGRNEGDEVAGDAIPHNGLRHVCRAFERRDKINVQLYENLRRRIAGAKAHCTQAKLTKKDLYDKTLVKYLVLVRDDVESAEERLQELQQELQEMGLFTSSFELGDILEDDLDASSSNAKGPKKKIAEFPSIEGQESVAEYVGQYRKAVLTRKALVKTAKERVEREQLKGHEYPG